MLLRSSSARDCSCASSGGSVPLSPSPGSSSDTTCPWPSHVTPFHAAAAAAPPHGALPCCHAAPGNASVAAAQLDVAAGSDSSAPASAPAIGRKHCRFRHMHVWPAAPDGLCSYCSHSRLRTADLSIRQLPPSTAMQHLKQGKGLGSPATAASAAQAGRMLLRRRGASGGAHPAPARGSSKTFR